jgi:hypothetical protein
LDEITRKSGEILRELNDAESDNDEDDDMLTHGALPVHDTDVDSDNCDEEPNGWYNDNEYEGATIEETVMKSLALLPVSDKDDIPPNESPLLETVAVAIAIESESPPLTTTEAVSDAPEDVEEHEIGRTRHKRKIVETQYECTCGLPVSDADRSDRTMAVMCSEKGCETLWVSSPPLFMKWD